MLPVPSDFSSLSKFAIDAAPFEKKDLVAISATIGAVARAWNSAPDDLFVPCTDANNGRFELLISHGRRPLFETMGFPLSQEGTAQPEFTTTLRVVGFWNKRMWRKTKGQGGWGHTWQLVVAGWYGANDQFHGALPQGSVVCPITERDTSARHAA